MNFYLTSSMVLATIVCLAPALLYVFGIVKDPFHPLIFVGSLTFFVATYFPLKNQQLLLDYLPGEIWARYQVLVLALVCAIYAGWHFSAWRRRRWQALGVEETIRPIDAAQYNPTPMFLIGSVLIVVGVIVFFVAYGDLTYSGYLRDLGTLWLPGGVLMIQVLVSGPRLRVPAIFMLILALVPPVDRFMVYGQRGDTARLALLVLCFYLALGRRPSKAMFLGGVLVLGIVMSSLGQTRLLVERGEAKNRIDAILKVGPSFFTDKPTELTGGEEFVYGTMATEHAREVNSWGHGTALTVSMLARTLPKEFFPWKYDYFYLHTNFDSDELQSMFGIRPSLGSAPSGIADLYIDQWWFCLGTWFLLGYTVQRLHVRASIPGNFRSQGIFIAAMVGLLYLITQEIYFGYLNVLYNLPPLLIAYRIARIKPADGAVEQTFMTETAVLEQI